MNIKFPTKKQNVTFKSADTYSNDLHIGGRWLREITNYELWRTQIAVVEHGNTFLHAPNCMIEVCRVEGDYEITAHDKGIGIKCALGDVETWLGNMFNSCYHNVPDADLEFHSRVRVAVYDYMCNQRVMLSTVSHLRDTVRASKFLPNETGAYNEGPLYQTKTHAILARILANPKE